MIIGIGKEIKKDESRVGLTPKKVKILIENNHTVLVEKDAGILSSFSNEDYINVGARIVEKPELYSKAELIIKVKNLFPEEVNLLSENQIIFTYLPLDENATPQFSKNLTKTKVNIIAYEWVCDKGVYVLLKPMSELTGLISAQRSLEILTEKKGIIGGGYITPIKAPQIIVIGVGIIGANAINVYLRNNCKIKIFDKHPQTVEKRLTNYIPEEIINYHKNNIQILQSSEANWHETQSDLKKHLLNTDILINCAVRRPTMPKENCNYLITKTMINLMPKNGVVIDATARNKDIIETAVSSPKLHHIYKKEDQWHYNCNHIPALVPITATKMLTEATFPYILQTANKGFIKAVKENKALLAGVVCAKGKMVHKYTCDKKKLKYTNIKEML